MYVKNFSVGKSGGVSASQAELLRKEFLESLQKLKRYKLIGPEAEEAIKAEQDKIESEGGSGMMCRAEECRRRLLKVSSADVLAEGTVERVAEDINELKLEVFSRKVVASEFGDRKEQSTNVYSVKFKILKNEKDNLLIQALAGSILAKKVSGYSISSDEEERVSGLKPLGRDNLDNMARSMFLPGWGQYSKGHYEKAFLFSAITAYGIYKSLEDWRIYNSATSAYEGSGGLSLALTNTLDINGYPGFYLVVIRPYFMGLESKRSVERANNSIAGLGAFYLFNILDAYFSEKRYFFRDTVGLSFDFQVTPSFANSMYYNANQTGFMGDYSVWLNYRF